MLTITEYEVEEIKDPYGIVEGTRYEFQIDIEPEEDDELYSELGVYVRVIYRADEPKDGIIKYDLYEKTTEKYLDFDLEEDELAVLETFCKEHLDSSIS